ncbi:MAG: glycerol-3-phosphate dehydrogenase, partial [Pseudolabrys sp.]
MTDFDLAIIGGGISGTGIARDAAGRGLRVLLVEMHDLGSGASSASPKMIHGGLRYLEKRAFRPVREALRERAVLLAMAPHVVWPTRFLLPLAPGGRNPLLMRADLLLYNWLGARKGLPASETVDLTHHPLAAPLKRSFRSGFEYSDCLVDDSRLVVLSALDAAEHGAVIRTRTRLVRAERGDVWNLVLNTRGRREVARARVLVNATGPWIEEVAETVIREPLPAPVRLIKGSHIVVRWRFEHDCGYLLHASSGRAVFALPFAEEFTLIGATEQNFVGDLNAPAPDAKEILYLCDTVNRYFRDKVTPDELVWSFAGVRALHNGGAEWRAATAAGNYVLAFDKRAHTA